MGTTFYDIAAEDARAEEYQEELYEFYKDHFTSAAAEGLIAAVESRHHQLWQDFLLEMQYAREAWRERKGTDDNLVAFFRAYRAIDWYYSQLRDAIAGAFVEPFLRFTTEGKSLKAREFVRIDVLNGICDRVIEAAFDPDPVRERLTEFFNTYRQLRHGIFHGVKLPSPDETFDCVSRALEIYDMADKHFNPVAPAPAGPL
jgi:hypothetical protein